ncbi:hypothetical protein Ac2012v2_002127 [Leucoagaricus gongylophorus]
MALSFIGKPISLISHSDVRYRGTLAGIDPGASTIQLSNVYSMGTESRRPPNEFIPPVQEPYQYIIFRASEVKDLAVDEPVPQRSVHDDPAVLGASAPGQASAGYSPYPTPAQTASGASAPAQQLDVQQQQSDYSRQGSQSKPASVAQRSPQVAQAPVQPTQQHQPSQSQPQQTQQPRQSRAKAGGQTRRTGGGASIQNAAASLETVERALGDLRVSNAQNGTVHSTSGGTGKRTGSGRQQQSIEQIKVPSTDFDFESMNAKFNKAALAHQQTTVTIADGPDTESRGTPSNDSIAPEKKKEAAYDRQRSFFDSLSSSTSTPLSGGPGGAGGRGGRRSGAGGGGSIGRNRREEERERNVATFGEPGGVGLMGPGAYVGGWGGYGRRGGRPRRGGAGGQGVSARG